MRSLDGTVDDGLSHFAALIRFSVPPHQSKNRPVDLVESVESMNFGPSIFLPLQFSTPTVIYLFCCCPSKCVMTTSTLGSIRTPMPKGCCQCIAQKKFSRRRSRRVARGENLSVAPTVVLIFSPENDDIVLCRWRSGTEASFQLYNQLCYDQSIQVKCLRLSKSEFFKDVISTCGDSSEIWSLASNGSKSSLSRSQNTAEIGIGAKSIDDVGSSFTAISMRMTPVPLVSISLSITTPLPKDARMQSHWKRQLVGSTLMFSTKYTSTMHFEENIFEVKGISPHKIGLRHSTLFVILPSTLITLQPAKPAKSKQSYPKETTSSPFGNLLIHTLTCIQRSIPVPRTFLLSGPPGVGKTYSIKLAVQFVESMKFLSIRGSELLQQPNAAQVLERKFHMAQTATESDEHDVALIFLDECDALVSVDSVAAMLAFMLDTLGKNVVVVGATNRVDSIPQVLRRAGRFDREIPIAPPNASERAKILQSLLPPEANKHTSEEIMKLAELCVGYVPADLTALVRRAALLAAQQGEGKGANNMLGYLKLAMNEVGASALRDASLAAPPKITWDDIAGDPGGAKTALRQAIEWPRLRQASFRALGLIPPRGILLHGPPGCAKTTLARAAAGASGVAFLSLSPAQVYASSYVGEAEATVRRAFTLARSAAPCILFFDELDSIFGGIEGEGRGSSAEARVLSTFLNEMDGVDNNKGKDGVLVLAATNRPWTLDAALLRPGRLGDKIIYIPPPDRDARLAILKRQFGGNTDMQFNPLVELSELFTGAELVGACQEAKMRLLRDITTGNGKEGNEAIVFKQAYMEDALDAVKPLLSDPRALEEFRLFEQNTTPR